MALPDTYQEVEWIQGTGSQYINTGFVPNQNSKAEFMVSNLIADSSNHNIFGANKGRQNSGFTIYYGQYGSTNGMYSFGSAGEGIDSGNIADGNEHTGELSKDGLYIDGIRVKGPRTYTFTSVNLYLFALNRNGSAIEYSNSGRIHYIKFYDNGTLARCFIPCYRKSDSVIGMYDIVNNVFYTNSGTGTFTKGPNVADHGKIKKFLLGTSLIRPYETPSTYEYEYDFRNKTWSTVQSDGWTLAQGTSRTTIDSNGILSPTRGQGSSNNYFIYRPIDCANASKITLYYQIYLVPASRSNVAFMGVGNTNLTTGVPNSFYAAIYNWGTTASGYTSHLANILLPNNESISSSQYIDVNNSGTYYFTGIVDLVNKTVSVSGTGQATGSASGTISDSTVATIRTGTHLKLSGGHDTGTIYTQVVKIKIEY